MRHVTRRWKKPHLLAASAPSKPQPHPQAHKLAVVIQPEPWQNRPLRVLPHQRGVRSSSGQHGKINRRMRMPTYFDMPTNSLTWSLSRLGAGMRNGSRRSRRSSRPRLRKSTSTRSRAIQNGAAYPTMLHPHPSPPKALRIVMCRVVRPAVKRTHGSSSFVSMVWQPNINQLPDVASHPSPHRHTRSQPATIHLPSRRLRATRYRKVLLTLSSWMIQTTTMITITTMTTETMAALA